MQTNRARSRLGPEHVAAAGVDTPHGRLEGTSTNHVIVAADATNHIDQPFNIIGTARCRDRRFPARTPVPRIHTDQTATQPDHQCVPDCQQHASLSQYQSLTRALLIP